MKKSGVILATILVLSLAVGTLFGGCSPAETSKLKVVTSTSLIAQIVERVGGDLVDVVDIVPPTQHPGDFDATPGDIKKLADADLFLWHGWPGETFVPGLITSADNPDLTVVKVDVAGNWMIPSVQLEATDRIAAVLSQADSQNSAAYQKAAAEYKDVILTKEAEIKARLAGANVSQVNVLCAAWQADFVGWAGLHVVATYGSPDSLTPQVVKELVDKGRSAGVTLVIDNLHSGRDAGKAIAEELGARRIILSNFPGAFKNTETWEKAIIYNVELILGAIAR